MRPTEQPSAAAPFSQIRYDVRDGIATITLARPEQLNAMTFVMTRELIAAFDLVDADDAVRAVVVTGEGRAFCAGADLSAGTDAFNETLGSDGGGPMRADGSIDYEHEGVRDTGGMLTLRIFRCLKPVIAAINGAAIGIGATMPLAMDIRLASTQARFGFVFTRRGIVPECASAWFLPRIVGIGPALDWCLSGRIFAAEEARAERLVKSLHEPADLLAAAYAIAQDIRDNTSPVSVALTRQMLWQGAGWDHPMQAHRIDSRGVFARARSPDAQEGVASFLEKRSPRYPDRVSTDMPSYFPWWSEPGFNE
jgi:enoyl-CoA hydratase/carnithine racemase